MCFDAFEHAGCPFGLHAINFNVGSELLDDKGNARNKATSSHGNNHRIDIGQLLYQFQTDGALPRNDMLVVERMHKGVATFVAQLQRLLVGIVINTRHQTHFGAKPSCCFYLTEWCVFGQTNEAFHTH